jgi:hypothetical protein
MSVAHRVRRIRARSSAGVRRDVSQDESSRRQRLADARRNARFSTVLTTRCECFPALPVARKLFPEIPRPHIECEARTRARVARSGSAEICCEPWLTGLTLACADIAPNCARIAPKNSHRIG